MHERGWHPHGFDINPAVARGRFPITVAPAFNASFVPQVDALLCREVIEHVENWPEFLTELTRAVKPHGLLQVQTPMPSEMHPNIYQEDHLQIFAPGILEAEISKRGFQIIESRRWTDVQAGQVLIARKH
jgi:2-polyprenyl-3-methyl-5-hydroxy-6-metoxy-1,4-benzoquinol methylase